DGMMDGQKGMFIGAGDHHATGAATLAKDKSGNPILLMADIKVDKVPDGRVYLAKDGDYTNGVELGKLTQFSGTVQYAIPASVNAADYNSVVIWCKKFSVEIGHAMLDGGMMKKDEMMKDGMMDKGMKK
ncbi:MAG: DM13 domain-containing protein, partial [Nitrospiria bacterium]